MARGLAVLLPFAAGALVVSPVASATPTKVDSKLRSAAAPTPELKPTDAVSIPGGGTLYRFHQRVAGVPVLNAEAVVSDPAGEPPQLVVDATQSEVAKPPSPRITSRRAVAIASRNVGAQRLRGRATAGLVIDPSGDGRLAWRVEIPSGRPLGDFAVLVDAVSGEIRGRQNLLQDFQTGRARLFDPNPVVEHGSFKRLQSDHQDRDTRLLTELRRRVLLPKIQGGQHCLRGKWATAKLGHDAHGVCRRSLRWKRVRRSADAFEALMVYYHITRAQHYVHDLGFSDSNGPSNGIDDRTQVAVADAFRMDNSFYSPFTRRIKYGSGGVDDAEDADVILHEYGHALQDSQSPAFLASQGFEAGSLAEGSADYWAAVMSSRSPRTSNEDDVCIFDWDATTYGVPSPVGGRLCGRRADDDRTLAEADHGGCSFDIHCVGQVWSSALWDLRRQVGGTKTDRLYFTAQFMYTANEKFDEAAEALLDADVQLNGGANHAAICHEMVDDRGLTVAGCP
jgi:Fungalysin metallopeptidase (M36)/Fungalysin/Thermolysin Propeptide Motif